MKNSVEELVAKAYEYFPKGMTPSDPGYDQTPEMLRQKGVRAPVTAQYETWRSMMKRLEARFPPDQFPGVDVRYYCFFLQDATVGHPWDRCFSGEVGLPVRVPKESRRTLDFFVSFIVPYYAFRSTAYLFNGQLTRKGEPDVDAEVSFVLTPDELPFAEAIAAEVEATFPGHEPMPPEVGLTIVPDVVAGRGWFGEATLFGCLFSDSM
ncbi:MAG: hypothetical protein ABI193_18930 [Minicystis sp.]